MDHIGAEGFFWVADMPIAFKPGAMESGAAPLSFEPTYSPGRAMPAIRPYLLAAPGLVEPGPRVPVGTWH